MPVGVCTQVVRASFRESLRELLIDCEENQIVRGVLVGTLRDMERR
jgi:hypothetical protein